MGLDLKKKKNGMMNGCRIKLYREEEEKMAAGEEKILVSVRVRPLNEKEKTRNDGCDWECINNTTIICKYHNLPDRPSYTFGKILNYLHLFPNFINTI